MSDESTSKVSQTDWARIDAMRDEDIDLSDIPEITAEQFARATFRMGGKPVKKQRLSLSLDHPILIENEGKPVAIILPIEMYEALCKGSSADADSERAQDKPEFDIAPESDSDHVRQIPSPRIAGE